jgi:hypothetical protein
LFTTSVLPKESAESAIWNEAQAAKLLLFWSFSASAKQSTPLVSETLACVIVSKKVSLPV